MGLLLRTLNPLNIEEEKRRENSKERWIKLTLCQIVNFLVHMKIVNINIFRLCRLHHQASNAKSPIL